MGSNPTSSFVWSIGAVVYLASLARRRAWVQIPHPPLFGPLEPWFISPPWHGGERGFKSLILLCLVHWSRGLSRLPVTEEIVGSNPTWTVYGGIGEGVNTLVCGSSMHGFESHIPPHNGGLAQLGEHLPYKQEVTGSSPVSSIFFCLKV